MTSSPDLLGKALRDARKTANWTQDQMAEFAGISRATLQSAEAGRLIGRRSEKLLREALAKLAGEELPVDPLQQLSAQVAALQHTVSKLVRGAA